MQIKEMCAYHNFAFISYSHRDMAVAKWLQKNLESFKLPTRIFNEIDVKSRYLRPIFRDQSDLNAGILGAELRKHLEESKYLILLCSKYSAQSQWVSDEAKAFVEMGRIDRIIPVILPDSKQDDKVLYPIYLREYFRQYPNNELLGINLRAIGKEKALIRIVSRMLDVSFDSLWKRHQRQNKLRIITYSFISILSLTVAYLFAVPVTLRISVNPQTSNLPSRGDITLNVDGGVYISPISDPQFEDIELPGYNRFSHIRITTDAPFFDSKDTIISTGIGIQKEIEVNLNRDNSFAIYKGIVYDDELEPLSSVKVSVAGQTNITNNNGEFAITIPIEMQRIEQTITLIKDGYKSVIREDETPGTESKFIMHKI